MGLILCSLEWNGYSHISPEILRIARQHGFRQETASNNKWISQKDNLFVVDSGGLSLLFEGHEQSKARMGRFFRAVKSAFPEIEFWHKIEFLPM